MIGVFGLLSVLSVLQVTEPIAVRALPMIWQIERGSNLKTGDKTCRIFSLGKNVSVLFRKTGAAARPLVSVKVGFDNQPASLRYLRVNRKIFQTEQDTFVDGEAEDIVGRLQQPGEFSFEWAKRPGYAKRQGLFGTGNFAASAAHCSDWLAGTRT